MKKITNAEYKKAVDIVREYVNQLNTNNSAILDDLRQTSLKLGYTFEEINNSNRQRYNVYRRVIMANYISGAYPNLTLQEIGKLMNKNHATIIHYLKSYNQLLLYKDFKIMDDLVNKEEELVESLN